MASYEWYSSKRNYELERQKEALQPQPTTSHPLKGITVTEIKHTETKGTPAHGPKTVTQQDFVDPLSSDPLAADGAISLAFEGVDPLSRFAAEAEPVNKARSDSEKKKDKDAISADGLDESFEPWSTKKTSILAKFTTSEKLSITTSFLSASDKEKVVIKTQQHPTTVTDKVRNRLEQLDDFEEGSVKEMMNLSQQDYVKRIEELNQALISAWENDQRVKSLKIAIQCSKLLADTSVIQFYPSKFVLVTEILDTFGRLVYDRLLEKAQYIPAGSTRPVRLPANFTPADVPESAKETCRNWFFKIASIRELIPRLYVECAILKSYSFLDSREYEAALERIALMTRGIGDPLVAVYARCYLARVGIHVAPSKRDHLLPCFNDFLCSFIQVQGDNVQNTLAMQKMEMPHYLTLFSPALDWILQCLAHRASDSVLNSTLDKCRQQCNNALLLNSIMSAFHPQFIATRATFFTEMIRECEDTGFPKHVLQQSLGRCLVLADPPEDQKLAVLNEVWKSVMKLKNPADYISCAEVWIEFVVKHFGKREVNKILADIIKHMTPDRAFEDHYPYLQSVMAKILTHMTDFSELFALDKFLPFLDMFQRDSIKVEVCKSVLESFGKHQVDSVNDPVVINAMMFLCKTIHDSVNALTLEDEKRVIAGLLSGFIHRVSFGRDFEQQLSFYVEARASFSNLDPVLVTLIQSVNRLSIDTRKVVKGNHSRKTAAFVRACAAYSFITIPSLQSVYSQLQLYLVSGQVALLNQCYSQADAFLKAAISRIAELPHTLDTEGKVRSSEPLLLEYICNFVSTLLATPDSPEAGVLYLLRGLLNMLQDYTWDANSDARVMAYTRVLAILSAYSQEDYLYRVDKVDANDAMYGGDPKFLAEVKGVADTLITQILAHLKTLSAPETEKRKTSLALELLNTVVAHSDMGHTAMCTLATNLWGLVQRTGHADPKAMKRLAIYIRSRAASGARGFKDLAAQIKTEM
ncbi:VPS35 endosomal protein-sorting factor-like [Babylonia areolata]|uniref:VPS35 endosomal protein-sorting factor-like n=1 Tax=Babylonia areolata TaxID=304850 RepID=UPI003FD1C81D